MPEFFDAAARYYPAGDGPALAAQLLAARTSGDPTGSRLKADAARRAQQFEWTITAQKTVAELRLALSS
jgi:hypothetical protein